MRTNFLTIITLATLAGCAYEVGSDEGDGCNDCSFEPLGSHRVPVASCSLVGTTITCDWADDGLLLAKPFTSLNGAMTVWVRSDERVQAASNDGTTIVYELDGTGWDGERVIIRTTYNGDAGAGEILLGETEELLYNADLEAGVELYSNIELWDIGLFSDSQLSPTVSFESSVMEAVVNECDVRKKANIFRIAVDPAEGLDIYSDGKLGEHAEQPGYYFFHTATSIEFDPEPALLD